MAFRSFLISMRILRLSNRLGRSFSLYLLVHLVKTYVNEWSRCSNDQISKNLWPLEVRMLLMQCCATQYCNAFGSLCCVDHEKLLKLKKKMHPKQTTEPKVMTFRSFQISMRILCQSNYVGRSFSLQLLVDLTKTYENWWSRCSNDQIIKSLWHLKIRNLLTQCYTTQYCYAFCNFGCVDLIKLYEIKKKKCIPNGGPSQMLWHFEASKFLCAFYASLITLDARFLYSFLQISQKPTKTGGHGAQMTKLSKTYGL